MNVQQTMEDAHQMQNVIIIQEVLLVLVILVILEMGLLVLVWLFHFLIYYCYYQS